MSNKDIPCWYELDLSKDPSPAIILRIYENCIQELKKFTCRVNELPFLKSLDTQKKFNFDFNKSLGFGEVLKLDLKTDLFSEFIADISKIAKKPELTHLTVLTFSAMFKFLGFQPEHSDSKIKKAQLMEVSTCVENKTLNARAMSGTFNPVFVRWLETFEIGHDFQDVVDAMISVYNLFYKTKKYKEEGFRAKIGEMKKGYLILGCPGTNCCQISPCNSWSESGGYDFGYHNIDYSSQQLTLLFGLAFLHYRARKAGVGITV